MNSEKLKKRLDGAIEIIELAHDNMVDVVDAIDSKSEIAVLLMEDVSVLATLKWYLEHISEEVGA